MSDAKNLTSEQQLDQEIEKMLAHYIQAEKILQREFDKLKEQQSKFPKKFSEKEDFEDYIILASQCKHQSIVLFKQSIAMESSIDADYEYLAAQSIFYTAEDFLKDKGFDKPTEALRKNYLSSKKGLKKIIKLMGNLKSIKEAAELLPRAFEADEVNFRKFLDLKNKLRGL